MNKSIMLFFMLVLAPSNAALGGPRQDRAAAAAMGWRDCVVARAGRYATQNEPSETLAKAAFASCVVQETEFRVLLKEATREFGLPFTDTADSETLDKAHAEFRQKLSDLAIATIVDARAKL